MWEWTLPSGKSPRKCRVASRSFTLEINARHVSEANILPELDGLADQLGALRKNLTGTEGVVPDLGVPHVVIRRQTDGCSVCLEFDHGIGRHQTVQRGRVCLCDGVAGGVRRQSDAVHDQCRDRAPDALKIGKMFQLFHTEEFLSFRRHLPRGIALPLYYTHFCRKKQEVSGNFA